MHIAITKGITLVMLKTGKTDTWAINSNNNITQEGFKCIVATHHTSQFFQNENWQGQILNHQTPGNRVLRVQPHKENPHLIC